MNFGYFDDEKREYVITRPDTPAPWANYLGSPEYGALISNNAGGMDAFYGTFLISLISREDIFILEITSQKITGLHPGSRWEKI